MQEMSDGKQFEKKTWLVVEDDFSVRMLVSTMLEIWGITPLAFADGYRVMEWLDEVEAKKVDTMPELALLDIRLPGPHGHFVAQRLRELSRTARIPIVIMTAYQFSPEEFDMICRMAQPHKIIQKPLPPPDELKALLEGAAASSRCTLETAGQPANTGR
jgi:CheY-like chemotaxis protein